MNPKSQVQTAFRERGVAQVTDLGQAKMKVSSGEEGKSAKSLTDSDQGRLQGGGDSTAMWPGRLEMADREEADVLRLRAGSWEKSWGWWGEGKGFAPSV